MKLAIGFALGIAAAISVSALAQGVAVPLGPAVQAEVEDFVYAGGKDTDGGPRMLHMTKDGRVLAKCDYPSHMGPNGEVICSTEECGK